MKEGDLCMFRTGFPEMMYVVGVMGNDDVTIVAPRQYTEREVQVKNGMTKQMTMKALPGTPVEIWIQPGWMFWPVHENEKDLRTLYDKVTVKAVEQVGGIVGPDGRKMN